MQTLEYGLAEDLYDAELGTDEPESTPTPPSPERDLEAALCRHAVAGEEQLALAVAEWYAAHPRQLTGRAA